MTKVIYNNRTGCFKIIENKKKNPTKPPTCSKGYKWDTIAEKNFCGINGKCYNNNCSSTDCYKAGKCRCCKFEKGILPPASDISIKVYQVLYPGSYLAPYVIIYRHDPQIITGDNNPPVYMRIDSANQQINLPTYWPSTKSDIIATYDKVDDLFSNSPYNITYPTWGDYKAHYINIPEMWIEDNNGQFINISLYKESSLTNITAFQSTDPNNEPSPPGVIGPKGSGNFGMANVFAISDKGINDRFRLGALPVQLDFKYATMDFKIDKNLPKVDPNNITYTYSNSKITFTNNEPKGNSIQKVQSIYDNTTSQRVQPIFELGSVQYKYGSTQIINLDSFTKAQKYAYIDSGGEAAISTDLTLNGTGGHKCFGYQDGTDNDISCYSSKQNGLLILLNGMNGESMYYYPSDYNILSNTSKGNLTPLFTCEIASNPFEEIYCDIHSTPPEDPLKASDTSTNLGVSLFESTNVTFNYCTSSDLKNNPYLCTPDSNNWPGDYKGYVVYFENR